MSVPDRLRRITDLFMEGTTLRLGSDESGEIVVFVKKLNDFEVEEARRDGVAQRGLRMMALADENGPELKAQRHLLSRMDDERLREARLGQRGDEVYLGAVNDLEAQEGWAEKVELMRRLPSLLADQDAAHDDPRRKQLTDLNADYLDALRACVDERNKGVRSELRADSRETLEIDYLEAWRQRESLDTFIAERRTTEMYLALHACQAVRTSGHGDAAWSHGECAHERLLDERSQVHGLPNGLLEKVTAALDGVTVPDRLAGNSDAPASSSDSSEPSSAAEATSAASSPAETSPGAPMT